VSAGAVAEPLSAADRASLAAETGAVNMAVGALLIFDGTGGLDHERVLTRLDQRLHLIPRYRQRVESPPLGLANPVWVDDEHFDLRWHVRAARLPAPGGDDELADYVALQLSSRLDRSRPLWQLHVIEGLAGGRVALMPKMHHALVDGVAAVDVGTVVLDPTPEPLAIDPPPEPWQPRPYALRRHLGRLAAAPVSRAQRVVLEGAQRALDTSPRRAAEDLRRGAELVGELARTRPQAPATPLNAPLGPNRRFALQRARLEDLKRAGRAGGGTINDALLAAVAGMLRRYLEAAGAPVGEHARAPVALVPVSVRREGEEGGNRISTVFVDLPVGEDDPIARVAAVAGAMRALKDSAAVRAGAVLVGATGWAPPVVSSILMRTISGVRAFNLVVSNVPGPQQPFYLDGARLLEAFPVVPLNPAHQRLSLGILSYDGGIFVGLLADRNLDPAVTVAAEALQAAIAELVAAT